MLNEEDPVHAAIPPGRTAWPDRGQDGPVSTRDPAAATTGPPST